MGESRRRVLHKIISKEDQKSTIKNQKTAKKSKLNRKKHLKKLNLWTYLAQKNVGRWKRAKGGF
jgi:hypothetical protein